MASGLLSLIVIVAILIIAWIIVERFSPDPTITLIAKIVIFVAALYILLAKMLPLAGVSF